MKRKRAARPRTAGPRSEPQGPGSRGRAASRKRAESKIQASGVEKPAERSRTVRELRRLLLGWYRGNRRDLPWRRTRDPYAIWISEAMLQQTRVETVIPYYERFLERFPDVGALASADLDDVLGLWAGLGYYSRARNLHRAAQRVAAEHGGALPSDPAALRALPGVGRYTAGAVASIAFDRPEPIVDGNIVRVLTRLFGIEEQVESPAVVKRLWGLAADFADGPQPGAVNQALMELGAIVCTRRAPRCAACPLASRCAARRSGDAEALPIRRARPQPRAVEAVAGWVVRRGRVLAVRRPARGLLGGLWELPGGELRDGEAVADAMTRTLRERLGLGIDGATPLGSVEHGFTHLALQLHVLRCEVPRGRVRLRDFAAFRWLEPRAFDALPHGAATRKALSLLRSAEVES